MANSALVLSIATDKIDVKFACEIGYACWLDKPIVLVNTGGPLPEKIKLIADRIIDVDWSTEAGRDAGAREVGRVVASMREEGIIP